CNFSMIRFVRGGIVRLSLVMELAGIVIHLSEIFYPRSHRGTRRIRPCRFLYFRHCLSASDDSRGHLWIFAVQVPFQSQAEGDGAGFYALGLVAVTRSHTRHKLVAFQVVALAKSIEIKRGDVGVFSAGHPQ